MRLDMVDLHGSNLLSPSQSTSWPTVQISYLVVYVFLSPLCGSDLRGDLSRLDSYFNQCPF